MKYVRRLASIVLVIAWGATIVPLMIGLPFVALFGPDDATSRYMDWLTAILERVLAVGWPPRA